MRSERNNVRGFSAIEMLIVVAIISIVAAVAYPSYKSYIVRTSREAAQSQLQQLANLQEKIFLNSNSYTTRITNAYTGLSGGGLGLTSGKTQDGKYAVSFPAGTTGAFTFTLRADPVTGTTQEGDGYVEIDHLGNRTWTHGSPAVVSPW
jgi:type IV pilus assembly protein PilE